MTEQELNNAFNSVIDKFVEESAKATDFQDDNGNINGFAIQQQNKAFENALRSLKNILLAEKQN